MNHFLIFQTVLRETSLHGTDNKFNTKEGFVVDCSAHVVFGIFWSKLKFLKIFVPKFVKELPASFE